jgi:hypothetical protein
MAKPDLLAKRASVKRPGRTCGLWRVQIRQAGLVVRTSWHSDWRLALADAINLTQPSIPQPRPVIEAVA